MNRLRPARYLGWSRIRKAQSRMRNIARGRSALDFGSGLGVMLPFLSQRYEHVTACDADPAITSFMVDRLGLENIEVVAAVDGASEQFDVVVALDVLEHVEDLAPVYEQLLHATRRGARWVISGPTENWLYRTMRAVAGTSGEGHVHTVAGVLSATPDQMRRVSSDRLPFGLPLFVVAEFVKE